MTENNAETQAQSNQTRPTYQDWHEPLTKTLYLRFQCGPNLEVAYLCLRDGEPDMHDLARLSFQQARVLQAAIAAEDRDT